MKNIIIAFILLALFTGCKKSPIIPAEDLGGGIIFDPSTYNPEDYLISVSKPNPTPAEALKPVVFPSVNFPILSSRLTTILYQTFVDFSL